MKNIFKNYNRFLPSILVSLILVFGVTGSALATWSYNGIAIPYQVTSAANNPPVVNAGPDQNITLPTNSANVTGSATDSDGTVVYTLWQFISGPVIATIGSQNNTTPSPVNLSTMTAPGTYVFRLNAEDDKNAWGSDDMQVVVTGSPSPSGTLSASGCTIASGASSCAGSVSWTTSNLTANPTSITRNTGSPASFTPSPLASGSQAATLGYGQTDFYLYHNSVLLAQASATTACIGGTTWNGTVCQNNAPSTPSVSLSVLPSALFSGNSAVISWTSANVSSCTASASPASGTWVGSRPTASIYPHESSGALSVTTTFTLSCTGASGNASDSKTVVVTPNGGGTGVIADLVATPDHIALGDSSTLSWSSSNATTCSGIGFSTGGAISGATSVSPTVNTTYTLNCSNATDSASDQATITLKRKFFFIEF